MRIDSNFIIIINLEKTFMHLVWSFSIQRYKASGQGTIILAGADYGTGSSRDWAAKGPLLLVSIQNDVHIHYIAFSPSFSQIFFHLLLIVGGESSNCKEL